MNPISTFDKLLYSNDKDQISDILAELNDDWVTDAWDHAKSFPKIKLMIAQWVEDQFIAGTWGPKTKEMLKNHNVTWAIAANDHPKRLEMLFHPEVNSNFDLSDYKTGDNSSSSIKAISFLNGMAGLLDKGCVNAALFIWTKNDNHPNPNIKKLLYNRVSNNDHIPMVDVIVSDVWLKNAESEDPTIAIEHCLSVFTHPLLVQNWGNNHPLTSMVQSMFRTAGIEGLEYLFTSFPQRVPWSVLVEVLESPQNSGISNSQLSSLAWLRKTKPDVLDSDKWSDVFERWLEKRSGIDFKRLELAKKSGQMDKTSMSIERVLVMMDEIYSQSVTNAAAKAPYMAIQLCNLGSSSGLDWFLQRCPQQGIANIIADQANNPLWDNMNMSSHPRIVAHILEQELKDAQKRAQAVSKKM